MTIKENAVELINEILEKSFVLSTIKVNDYTSFEFSLRKNSGDINNVFMKKPKKNLVLMSTASVRSALTGELHPDYNPEEDEDMLEAPKSIFNFIEEKELKNAVIMIKDYDTVFKKRADMLNLYHTIEEYYPQLQKKKNKIILLSKNDLEEMRPETESDFKSFGFSNRGIMKQLITEAMSVGIVPKKENEEVEDILDKFEGLTYQEVKNIIHDEPTNLEEVALRTKRERILALNPEIEIVEPGDLDFSHVAGFDNFKVFLRNIMARGLGKASLLLGVPGSGKSYIAKAAGGELGLPTIIVDIGSMQNKYVGETEKNTKRLLDAIDSYGPAIVFIDEIDKGLAGTSNTGGGDNGVSKRQGGAILKWMNDRPLGYGYIIGTANNIDHLPPEFKRAGRWDNIFYSDFPSEPQLLQLVNYYSKKYDVPAPEGEELDSLIDTMKAEKTTGAEVEALFRMSTLLGLSLEDANAFVTKIGSEFDNSDKNRYSPV